jgi:hypothetical protein
VLYFPEWFPIGKNPGKIAAGYPENRDKSVYFLLSRNLLFRLSYSLQQLQPLKERFD